MHVAVGPRESTPAYTTSRTHTLQVRYSAGEPGAAPVSVGFVQMRQASTNSSSSLGDAGLCLREAVPLHFPPSLLSLHRGPQQPGARQEQPPGLPVGGDGSCLKRGCSLGLTVTELLAFLPRSHGKTVQAPTYPATALSPHLAGRSQINTRPRDSDPSPMVLCETCINVTRSTMIGFLSLQMPSSTYIETFWVTLLNVNTSQ